MDEKDVNLLKSKKGSWTHPTPLGIVRRHPPQFYNILCHNENFYAIELLNSPQIPKFFPASKLTILNFQSAAALRF